MYGSAEINSPETFNAPDVPSFVIPIRISAVSPGSRIPLLFPVGSAPGDREAF